MNPFTLVVAAALRDAAGRVLMQRRPAGKAHAGLWEFPGGKVEPGETPHEALVREIREELGVALCGDPRPLGFAQTGAGAAHPLVLLLYGCSGWEGVPTPEAGAALGWFSGEELAGLAMPPLDVDLVAMLTGRNPW